MKKRIIEVAIPTFYGDEVCYVNGMKYAREITADVLRYRAQRVGFGSGDLSFRQSFRRPMCEAEREVLSVLDGCAPVLVDRLLDLGHDVVRISDLLGVQSAPTASGVDLRLDDQISELEEALEKEHAAFDVVLALD